MKKNAHNRTVQNFQERQNAVDELKMEWRARVKKHYETLVDSYGKDAVLGVFLYGSQNHGLADELSDVDTIGILVPSFDEMAEGDVMRSRQIPIWNERLEKNEFCTAKDIRLVRKELEKQNPNFVEILFTDYGVANPDYEDLWTGVFTGFAESIAHYDEAKVVSSCMGMISRDQKKSTPKSLAEIMRVMIFLVRYCRGCDYKECLDLTKSDIVADEYISLLKRFKRLPNSKEKNEYMLTAVPGTEAAIKIIKENFEPHAKMMKVQELMKEAVKSIIIRRMALDGREKTMSV